ncbi:hypothetical protein [Vibrio parahaemolyticus]|uniref:hypothetical protein n=1 Tax=Vibrio parahaemolyticus TaxID=670 RepID=UPI0007B6E702|nr:hypothetical protein [Vibrio parahaemolyticus]ANB96717.1 hypothetical protein FORC14_1924 [Vibrio parahaemolyticus]
MKAEFEEKDYEAPLYGELKFGSHRFATPGQVFEGKIGIDAALEAQHPLFWDLFGYNDIPTGAILNDFRWGFIWRTIKNKTRLLPTFKTNLLIQAKRPHYLKRSTKVLKGLGIQSAHWRIEVTPHQQVLLEKVSDKLRNRALVVYAAPAFHTFDDLYNYTEHQEVFENSSFVKVNRMADHEKWLYDAPGTRGVAHSIPETIEDDPIHIMVEKASKLTDGVDFLDNVNILHKAVSEACLELKEVNPLARYYLSRYDDFEKKGYFQIFPEATGYFGFSLFCYVAKLNWIALQEEK